MSNPKPISENQYNRITAQQWRGRPVITLQEISTFGGFTYPIGSRALIVGKNSGFQIKGEPCPCCGVSVNVGKVRPHKLALADEAPLLETLGVKS